MNNLELTIFLGFIGMLLDSIELNALPLTQLLDLLRQRNPQPTFQDLANFVVVMVHLGLERLAPFLASPSKQLALA